MSGQIAATDLVWTEGMPQWLPARNVPRIFPQGTSPQSGSPIPMNYYAPPPQQMSLQYAGFWIRFVAAFLDGIITGVAGAIVGGIAGLVIGLGMGGSGASAQSTETAAGIIGQILGILIAWLYSAYMESSSTQATLGKMAVGIRVTDLNGRRISFGRATGRHFAKFVSTILLFAGYIMVAFTERKQGMHDMMASTLVVKK